jgi:hypothetical protein
MMPEIKKILYTTDLSENSTYVFRHAINFAKKMMPKSSSCTYWMSSPVLTKL